jgi:hypothetical protein
VTCQTRFAFGLFGALGFLVLAAAAPSQPREVPTCDLEIRFVDNQYQWRCSLEAAPCVQCDIDGTCVRHPGGVPPLPGQVECRCKTATDYQFDTCYGVIEITESGVDVLWLQQQRVRVRGVLPRRTLALLRGVGRDG